MTGKFIILPLAALVLPGCLLFLSSGLSPRVEDCVQIRQATPTQYYCGGKLFTSVQLADIRSGKAPALRR